MFGAWAVDGAGGGDPADLALPAALVARLADWQVIHFDDDRRDMAKAFGWPATGDWRGFFEYEIDAAVVASGQPPVWVEPSK